MMTVYRLVLLETNIKYGIINQKNVIKNSAYFKIVVEEMKYGKDYGTLSGSAGR